MKNRYLEKQSKILIGRAKKNKTSSDLALCVYVSNLLGADTSLVLHGGGNTSVKSEKGTLFIKGSGSDLRTINASDFIELSLKSITKLQ